MVARLNDASEITIPLRNLLALIAGTAIAVMGYFRVGERLSVLERNAELSSVQIEANSEFRILWPRGELGSLPADAQQFMMLEFHQLALDEIRAELDRR
ncbi:hypothetical protein [Thalassospira alkalitolerans]|jgi:hypothetical protein|uniref:hypothetical protein n=1 Tax=Thalassospira alkalitolerans TaxID=1293890 RepID=UPI0030EC60ED|tara:strand:- start:3092 stop:3388 length:297 start_codon:yes stop_codon:yes gene_type:complete